MAFVFRVPADFSGSRLTARRPRACPRRAIRPFLVAKANADDFPGDYSLLEPASLPTDSFPSTTPGSASVIDPAEPEPQHNEPDFCDGEFVVSPSLQEFREQREAGLISSAIDETRSEWADAWALSVGHRKGYELRNQYSRVSILIERNFADFEPAPGCKDVFNNASLEEISMTKAKQVYEATGLPAIAETNDFSIDAPESGSRINKTLQQGYYTRNVDEDADAMIDRVRPISDENRVTRFNSSVAYFDGEIDIIKNNCVEVSMAFSGHQYATIASTAALDELYKELTRRLGLTLEDLGGPRTATEGVDKSEKIILVGATLLKERILRDGKMLREGIIKVSSFLNHMVDTDLMEVCGEELAERLRQTMPNKLLTVESTGLIVGLPTARKLGIPLVFARKSRPITISDSYQTTYRSATKGTTNDLIVSCEYLEPGDRVLIIDDFLAGGSTAEGLFRLAKMAHAKVVGVGVLIEKMSDGGRTFLAGYDVPVESLAKILPGGDDGRIKFVEEDPWVSPLVKKEDRKSEKEEAVKTSTEYYTRAASAAGAADVDDVGLKEAVEAAVEAQDALGEDDDDDAVHVISWEDEEMLDDLEEDLIRGVGKT